LSSKADRGLSLVPAKCCVCDTHDADLIGSGLDYEYETSSEVFHAYQCSDCETVYLNPRPDVSEFARIYPDNYHTLEFSEANYSIVHKVRSRLEARRLLNYCTGIPADARILDVGCGDGFHLRLLREFGKPGWSLEGIDFDSRAVDIAVDSGLNVRQGSIEEVDLPPDRYDLIYTLQTLEHVASPDQFLLDIRRILKPGGRLVIVTDNTDSLDFALFKKGSWGGYHFPRHWYLFNRRSLHRLADKTGFEVPKITTIVSPVNWVYSLHNLLSSINAPSWVVARFTLKSPVSLAFFTLIDAILQRLGRGALLNAYLSKPS
jgi:SAM-dependent methyltransferase